MAALFSGWRLFSDTAEGSSTNGTKVSLRYTGRDWSWVVKQLEFVEEGSRKRRMNRQRDFEVCMEIHLRALAMGWAACVQNLEA